MKLKKKKKTFDNVILSMENRHWKNSNFDGFPVGVTSNWQIDEDKLLYDEYEKVKKILKPPLREIHEYAFFGQNSTFTQSNSVRAVLEIF